MSGGILPLPERLMHLPAREFPWQLERFERQDSMCRRSLHSRPAPQSAVSRSGACGLGFVPIWFANKSVRFLGFDALQGEKKWSDDDIALVRTVGEIFANALERKRAEAQKEALEVQLRQAQRMEAIGTLAGGIAHDFNTVLSAILGYGELAIAALPEAAARGGTCKR